MKYCQSCGESAEDADEMCQQCNSVIFKQETIKKDEISKGLKIYDYVLAGISGLEFIWQLYLKISGNSTREWLWVLLPLFLVFGLLQHKKVYRIICSIILFGSIILTLILFSMAGIY